MKLIYPNYTMIAATNPSHEGAEWANVKDKLDWLALPYVLASNWLSISAFNREVNSAIHYVSDLTDHWQTPEETSGLSTGDCEDFAIYKMAALKKAGFAYADMCLMLGEIASLSGNQPHAYLIIELDGEQRVLDSKFDQLIKPTEYINWQPHKAIIDDKVWLFAKQFTIADTA